MHMLFYSLNSGSEVKVMIQYSTSSDRDVTIQILGDVESESVKKVI